MRLDGTDVAGPPGVVPDTTLPPIPAPHQLYQTGLPGVTISGPPSNTLAPPSVAAQAAPPQPVAQPPTAPPPAARPVATGVNSPQFQAAAELNRRAADLLARYPQSPRVQAQAAYLKLQAQAYMQADSVVQTPDGQVHTLTGKIDDPAKPLANFVWNQERKAFVDTGGHYPPVTPRPGSITVLPDGRVYQSDPGGGVTDITRTDPAGIAARKAAEAQGTQAGTASGKLPTELANQGAEATRAISTLDEGAHNIALAKQGGINPGYFAPWLTGVASMAKSIGGDEGTKLLGIDPSAVGDIQTARKTLAIVSSSILKQTLGDSQITDAKIEHFIHAQPGIETDPDALVRVMNWARSQFVYEREMAAQAMEDTSAETGTLPLNWKQKYYSKHGFGPIYNPEAAQMQQPEGRAPAREPPALRRPGRTPAAFQLREVDHGIRCRWRQAGRLFDGGSPVILPAQQTSM